MASNQRFQIANRLEVCYLVFMDKHCSKCGGSVVVARGLCRECYGRWHYLENKAKYLKQNKARRKRARDYVAAVKSKASCLCGESHPACLTFHHRDPSEKSFDVAHAQILTPSLEKVQAEIDKCDIMCFNCHMKLHAQP